MKSNSKQSTMNRREFNKRLSVAAVGVPFLLSANPLANLNPEPEELDRRNERSTMTYRKLGRTNFMCSRLVFGCGAALVGGRAVRLLDYAFEAGINYYDCGTEDYYKENEKNFAPFLKSNKEEIWVTSKGAIGNEFQVEPVGAEQIKAAVTEWNRQLEQSLKNLQTEYLDGYFMMNVTSPSIVMSDEMYKAFLDAKSAGKVGHFGLATHKNAKSVLEAAIKTGWYDVAMVGITPAGWYDWTTKDIEKDTPSLTNLQPLLKLARDSGIGLIGMKAVRYLASMGAGGREDVSAFDKYYDQKFLETPLNPYQRSYAYVLENGLDVVNADMQNFTHLEENIEAAANSEKYIS